MVKLWYKIYKSLNKIKRNIFINYYKQKIAGGNEAFFYGNSLPIIKGEDKIYLGKGVKINEYAYLYARGNSKIVIGKNTTLSSYCKLITAQYDVKRWLNEEWDTKEDLHVQNDIVLGDHCWVASGVIILGGVEIKGENVIIAAGSVVTKSFEESNIILGGVPAKIIKHIK